VAFLVKKEMEKFVLGHKAVSPRFNILNLKTWTWKISLINVYAPDSSRNSRSTEEYTAIFDLLTENLPNHKYVVLGDLNVQIGNSKVHPNLDKTLIGIYNYPAISRKYRRK
jgi:exonuclease III